MIFLSLGFNWVQAVTEPNFFPFWAHKFVFSNGYLFIMDIYSFSLIYFNTVKVLTQARESSWWGKVKLSTTSLFVCWYRHQLCKTPPGFVCIICKHGFKYFLKQLINKDKGAFRHFPKHDKCDCVFGLFVDCSWPTRRLLAFLDKSKEISC